MAEQTFTWTDETRAQAVSMYKERNPTPENTLEIIKEIAEELGTSPNGVRMILSQAKAYVKVTPAGDNKAAAKTGSKTTGEGTKRVSKESQIEALREAIKAKGVEPDDDILSKLTGKAAAYLLTVVTA